MLKARPEIDRLYQKICVNGQFDFPAFERFMHDSQEVSTSEYFLHFEFIQCRLL